MLANPKLTRNTSGGGVHLQGLPKTPKSRNIRTPSARKGDSTYQWKVLLLIRAGIGQVPGYGAKIKIKKKSKWNEQGCKVPGCGASDGEQQSPFMHFQLPPNEQWSDPSIGFFINFLCLDNISSSQQSSLDAEGGKVDALLAARVKLQRCKRSKSGILCLFLNHGPSI